MSLIAPFMTEVLEKYKTGMAREHAYRPAIEKLLKSLDNTINPMNDAARIAVGAPDFILLKDNIHIGYLEAKDIGLDLRTMKDANKAQQQRYLAGLPNLIYTNCLDWDFYQNGQLVATVTIGDYLMGIQPRPDQYGQLESLLRNFVTQRPQTITTPRDLAERMAGKAQIIKDVLFQTISQDVALTSEISGQYKAFQHHLIHDISVADFSDVYAETIAYGMFAARLHDTTPDTFSRTEALDLLPKSNPFLRNLFGFVAGPNLDDRIKWVIDDLADIFRAANITQIMAGFGKLTAQNDPFLHFYETFLGAYDPKKRKARGVWYTPEPVVNFIVRAVDDVLRDEFGLAQGLADTSKVRVDWDTGQTHNAKPVTEKRDLHRVQILDPATGTGTFLAEVIKHIAPRIKAVGSAAWPTYIEQNLIPRLHGFELLMAAYAMCHLKLDMILQGLGYVPTASPPRMGVYLTNSLEQGDADVRDLFMAKWLSDEARAASSIKRQTPIMCVIGNPPYSGHSSNKGSWINGLMDVYKQSEELKRPAQAKWLSDDYVKFLRFAEHLIEKNGEGVLGFITNHAYLDNPTFLDMRHHLMKTFDRIYILDLHGNAKKKEVAPDGGADKNVFDIMQGVAIIVAVKKASARKTPKTGKVFHADLWGARAAKYAALQSATLANGGFFEVTPEKAPWNFKAGDKVLSEQYSKLPSIGDWFSPNGRPAPGIVTTHDEFAISRSASESIAKVELLLKSSDEADARKHFSLCGQAQWNYEKAKADLGADFGWKDEVAKICYRPFDTRTTIYNSHVAVHRRDRVMGHYLRGENFGIIAGRQGQAVGLMPWNLVFCSQHISDFNLFYRGGGASFPLYLYSAEGDLHQSRRVNFDAKLYAKLQGLAQHPAHGTPNEVQVFDYIYGVLHCPAYRQTYAEFLKIDFPRIPWPKSPDGFWNIAAKGAALRALHLMQPAAVGDAPYPFEGAGDCVVVKPRLDGGHIWINDTQRFENIPAHAWEFYIGGYQPAQKWLKDRRGRALSFDDIRHYQSVLKILSETARIMATIQMEF